MSVDVVAVSSARDSRRRVGLFWSATSIPVAPFVALGMVLGPGGTGILSTGALAALDPAIVVGLGVLGVLVGLGIELRSLTDRRFLAAGSIESATTAAVVAGGLTVAARVFPAGLPDSTTTLAVCAGVAAASSLALPNNRVGGDPSPAQRTMELDVVLPIVVGGLALSLMREGSIAGAASLTLQASALVLLIATAAWLLLDRGPAMQEARIFGVATLLLVGGAADYLAFSALLGGLLAGASWRRLGGGVRDGIERDVLRVRHPLVVLVLLTAGARTELTVVVCALATLYAVLRTLGKFVGGHTARRTIPLARLPGNLGARLLPPGVFGIAFALNALRAGGPELSMVLSIAVMGTVLADVLAMVAGSRQGGAA